MSVQFVAEGRRRHAVMDLQGKRAITQREIGRGGNDAQGLISPYLTSRIPVLQAELDRIDAEIAELGQLEGDELSRRFVPEAYAPDEEPVHLIDTLKRGTRTQVSFVEWEAP